MLIDKVQLVTTALHKICRGLGLDLNYDRGKTEYIIKCVGRGTQAASRKLQAMPGQRLPLLPPFDNVAIPNASAYTHLGYRQVTSMKLEWEIQSRIAQASEAMKEAAFLLRNQALSLPCKVTLVESLIISKALYGSETWLDVTEEHVAKLHAFHLTVVRCCLGEQNRKWNVHSTDEEISMIWPGPAMTDYLHVARLRHLQRVLQHGPGLL